MRHQAYATHAADDERATAVATRAAMLAAPLVVLLLSPTLAAAGIHPDFACKPQLLGGR
jgi:hypothetical protein